MYTIKLNEEDYKLLEKYIPEDVGNLTKISENQYSIEDVYFREFQSNLDDAIVHHGLTSDQDRLNDVGRVLQKLYDDIHYDSVHE